MVHEGLLSYQSMKVASEDMRLNLHHLPLSQVMQSFSEEAPRHAVQ